MAVVGAGVLPRTFMDEKSVWVSSSETGPRSVVAGTFDGGGKDRWVEVVRPRKGPRDGCVGVDWIEV